MEKKLRIEKIRKACVYKNKVKRRHRVVRIVTLLGMALLAVACVLANKNIESKFIANFVIDILIVINFFVVLRNESIKETNLYLAQKNIVNLISEHTFGVLREQNAIKTFGNKVYFKSQDTEEGLVIQITVHYNGYDVKEKEALREKIVTELEQVEQSVANITKLTIDVVI